MRSLSKTEILILRAQPLSHRLMKRVSNKELNRKEIIVLVEEWKEITLRELVDLLVQLRRKVR